MPTFLSRYLAGEHERVWAELVALGPRVHEEPFAPDAHAVARATMHRAKENVRRIVARLGHIGYRFELSPLAGEGIPNKEVHVLPAPDVGERIAELEATAGLLPLSLRAWYETVGSVNLMGRHPDWNAWAYPDPLVVEGLEGWRFEYEDWLDARAHAPDWTRPFVLPIAPDFYHKAHVSGGAPYGMELPCQAADAPLVEEWHETTFVDYLRICFRWGGFPGWAMPDEQWSPSPGWSTYEARPREHLAYLSRDLLPL